MEVKSELSSSLIVIEEASAWVNKTRTTALRIPESELWGVFTEQNFIEANPSLAIALVHKLIEHKVAAPLHSASQWSPWVKALVMRQFTELGGLSVANSLLWEITDSLLPIKVWDEVEFIKSVEQFGLRIFNPKKVYLQVLDSSVLLESGHEILRRLDSVHIHKVLSTPGWSQHRKCALTFGWRQLAEAQKVRRWNAVLYSGEQIVELLTVLLAVAPEDIDAIYKWHAMGFNHYMVGAASRGGAPGANSYWHALQLIETKKAGNPGVFWEQWLKSWEETLSGMSHTEIHTTGTWLFDEARSMLPVHSPFNLRSETDSFVQRTASMLDSIERRSVLGGKHEMVMKNFFERQVAWYVHLLGWYKDADAPKEFMRGTERLWSKVEQLVLLDQLESKRNPKICVEQTQKRI